MDYKQELEKMQKLNRNKGEFWKASPGIYDIEFLEEPIESEPFIDVKRDKTTPTLLYHVKVNNQIYKWKVGVNYNMVSTHYQLMRAAALHDNKFLGLKITMKVEEVMVAGNRINIYHIM